jgi:guanine deaminase
MFDQIVRGPLLVPQEDGLVQFYEDGALAADARGILQFVGNYSELDSEFGTGQEPVVRQSDGIMMPPLLDIHIHIPQHPIRGRFVEGVPENAPGGKLLAGLHRNVFPVEAECAVAERAEKVVRQFLVDTLSHGVVGGAAYMTVSVIATEIALTLLPETWSVGLVMMNQNCPENLRTDEKTFDEDVKRLAKKFGRRLIVTDRFAVAVNTPLRKRASNLAGQFGLRTQTHLNEQIAEKAFVENTLYPHAASYTDVYRKDGLLDHQCIAAHCIQMTGDEWGMLRDSGGVIAHCPTSNFLLGSGVMSLDEVIARKIPFAIATDVGASPTVSMLAEMKRFMAVHAGRSIRATAVEAVYRATLAPAEMLGISSTVGSLKIGSPMSFIEVVAAPSLGTPGEGWGEGESERREISSARNHPHPTVPELKVDREKGPESVIQSLMPEDVNQPASTVERVTMAGETVFERRPAHA